ncbi:GATA transcription factor 18-like [Humulus lupulus]|uniref:GATA transcription factor 18-like n=1 Tax=Humulus lupulus TaxID=3486 RepID=UPI002B4094FD|nr:GATA transcription factor 18-like [Humulus lupulus]
MMHRCSSSQGNMVGPCSCGLYHSQSNSFSMLFSMPNHKPYDNYDQSHQHHDMYSFASPSSSVDCTLSLGTPSTRLSTTEDYYDDNSNSSNNNNKHQRMRHSERRNDSCVSNFCWDLLQPNKQQTTSSHKNSGRSSSNSSNSAAANDPLLARRCANCDTTSTPLWRNGPRGPKSLCNACGIRFKKEERRAAATSTANGATSGVVIEPSHMFSHHNNPWSNINHHHQYQHSQAQKMPCLSPAAAMGNEFRFMDDENHEPAADSNGISFLSWRLNVTDRPSLVHDFTR